MQIPFKDRGIVEAGKSQAAEEQVQVNSDDFNLGLVWGGTHPSSFLAFLNRLIHAHTCHIKGTTGCLS